ncbi:MAG: hypothetical protein RLZZ200_1388 [Pseudomonadota bacterium]|jgi:tetratricopeptide (TPR) repeat protein
MLAPTVYIPGRQGSLQAELVAATRRHARLPWVIEPRLDALVTQLDAHRPVLVLQNFGSARSPLWHYAVVIGYEPGQRAFLLRSGVTELQRLPARRFIATWARGANWGLTVHEPGDIPAEATADTYLRAASGLENAGQARAAERAYDAATRRWPDAPNAWFALAGLRLGQPREAEALYERVIALSPDHAAARNNLAVLLGRRGCVSAALMQIGRARRSAPPALASTLDETAAELAALEESATGCPTQAP